MCVRMTLYHQDIVFVVMENMFHGSLSIDERYDLKVREPMLLPYLAVAWWQQRYHFKFEGYGTN